MRVDPIDLIGDRGTLRWAAQGGWSRRGLDMREPGAGFWLAVLCDGGLGRMGLREIRETCWATWAFVGVNLE